MLSKRHKSNCGKNIIRISVFLISTFILCWAPGCLYVATHNAGLQESGRPLDFENYDILNKAGGESSSFRLFWFIPVTPEISREEAIDNAIINGDGHNIVNVRFYEKTQVLILGTVKILYAEGKTIKYKEEQKKEE